MSLRNNLLLNKLIFSWIFVLFLSTSLHAGMPVWSFSTPKPASVTVSSGSTATVQYTITNNSSKEKNLLLAPTVGLSASSCYLAGKGSTCVLTLTVNGSQVPKQGIHSGPVLCERSNPVQCYQPEAVNQMSINTSTNSTTIYAVAASGDAHVFVAPTSQAVISGATGVINLTLEPGYVASIVSDSCGGSLLGTTYTTGTVTADCAANFSSSIQQLTVTANGDIHVTPNPSSQQVNYNATGVINLTLEPGYVANIASDTCGGSLLGTTYTTGTVTADCAVSFSSSIQQFVITANGDTHVTPSPLSQQVNYNATGVINLTVEPGDTASIASDTCGGSLLGTTYTTGTVTANCSVSFGSSFGQAIYTGIYVSTDNFLTTYSIDNGSTWSRMLNQVRSETARAVDANNVLYVAMDRSGSSTLIYTQDGVNWSSASALPDSNDGVYSVFALNNTVYVGTWNGSVLYSMNQGVSWNTVGQPDGSGVGTLAMNSNGTLYAGTDNGFIFSSSDNGVTWNPTPSQPGGNYFYSLSVSAVGTIYVVTDISALPLYSTNDGVSWISMGPFPSGNNFATTLSAVGTTVYVGTDTGNVLYTTDNGTTWTTASSQPDGSMIRYLVTAQSTLSPLFVETSGVILVNGGQASVTVKNLSTSTASNVQAQIPLSLDGVTQDANDCISVAPQASCTLHFTSTKPYAPQNIPVTASNLSGVISRIGLVFSMNGYQVYNVDGTHAYVVDNTDVSGSPKVWSTTYNYIPGTSENDTTPCNGATDGKCNSQQIVAYYDANGNIPHGDYAAGLCYESTLDSASKGEWYLPSTCELNGGLYDDVTTNIFVSCTPVVTGILSLHSLQMFPNASTDLYSSSTASSYDPQHLYWGQSFFPGGGGILSYNAYKGGLGGVRCVRALPF